MNPSSGFDILRPLSIGVAVALITVLVQMLPIQVTINLVRRERKLGLAGTRFWIDFRIVIVAVAWGLVAHLINIGLWASVFMLCGEFRNFSTAFYHSAVNYTSLGYGDLLMTPRWRLLGPLETADGLLLFGVSTAMVFTIIQKLVSMRYAELRD